MRKDSDMKKIITVIALLLFIISLPSCIDDNGADISGDSTTEGSVIDDNSSAEDTKNDNTTDSQSIYKFKVSRADGYEVAIDANMADVLASLGEPLRYNESPSCAYTGLDKEYIYAGFKISTRPDGENDFVNAITLTDDSVTTEKGIYIGSSAFAVKAAYGDGEESEYNISYTNGNTTLSFALKDGYVTSIDYLSA